LRRLQDKHILSAVAGQAIYAPWLPKWNSLLPLPVHAPHACNGHGHFVPAVPLREGDGAGAGECWFSGATYVDSADAQAAHTDADEEANLQRLRELLPAFADTLTQQVNQGQIRRFVGVRCTTPTRQPMVQALAAGLWLCTGFGSRGLSHAPLAAEYLAQNL
jgi:tRNA 5-methylaminomethyl-2-thiouridine biosynthesis bifunctional protein